MIYYSIGETCYDLDCPCGGVLSGVQLVCFKVCNQNELNAILLKARQINITVGATI